MDGEACSTRSMTRSMLSVEGVDGDLTPIGCVGPPTPATFPLQIAYYAS